MAIRLIVITLAILFSNSLWSQEYTNLRKKVLPIDTDTITLDTLSIIPGSLTILSSCGNAVDPSIYSINFAKAHLYPSAELRSTHSEIVLEYRVFPLLLERNYSKRNYHEHLSPDSLMGREPPRYALGSVEDPLSGDQIKSSGSIMRGIRFGNNQNLSVNSSMNLTFSGELGRDLMIEGAISDQSVPIQPDGTTRRLEEFDRIYLRVYRDDFSIQAGDIAMQSPANGSLLSFSRNVQGLAYDGLFANESDTLIVRTAMAVPKGKFARNHIQGTEGNQGPYRLQGTNGEPFIIVLSASERVYVDGVLLNRGEDQHYIVNYNAAEITFTNQVLINRNSRIQVEFEYSERSYARFNTYANIESRGNKWDWHFSAYAEQDSRNQPFDQELTDSQKQHLAAIGDNLDMAFYPMEERVAFDPEMILYQKKDTIVGGQTYSIYIQSINQSIPLYRVYFSYMGPGKGSYLPNFGNTNGRVYRWAAPQNGKLQGSYEPTRRLVPPQKKQIVQAGISRLWSNNSIFKANYALSNTDLNTFSQLNSDDNFGHGIQLALAKRFRVGDNSTRLGVGTDILKTTDGFQGVDRFRNVEFERDWSIAVPLNGSNEQMVGVWFEVEDPQKVYAKAVAESLRVGTWYNASRGSFSGWNKNKVFNTVWNGSVVSATDTAIGSLFFKANLDLRRTQGFLNFKLKGDLENSIAKTNRTDSLLVQSFSWYQLRASVNTPDTLSGQVEFSYIYRQDFKPYLREIKLLGVSQEFELRGKLHKDKAGSMSSSIGFREFNPNNTVFADIGDLERTALVRQEYSNRFFNGLWLLSGGYELGSGLEPDAEFYFFEVPAGQGVYTWVDYNGNGIMELDEFEVANFPDEARFIRINLPGTRLISVRNNALSIRSSLTPLAIIKGREGLVKQIGRLSNLTTYRIQQKNRFDSFWQSANPFVENPSDTLITSMSANIRNALAYNRLSRKFGMEYIYSQVVHKSIHANGFEQKEQQSHRVLVWFGLGKNFLARTEGEELSNKTNSQFFMSRNYSLTGYNAQQSLKYLSEMQHSFEVGYRWSKSSNSLSDEQVHSQTFFLSADLVFTSKGSIMGKGSYVNNNFSGASLSAVAYEMMRGLQPGQNVTWDISVKRRLSKLFELEVGYNGRYINRGGVVHSGFMQARALF